MKKILISLISACYIVAFATCTASENKNIKIQSVMFNPIWISVDMSSDKLSYCADCGVMKSDYTYYDFKHTAFLKNCGGQIPKKPFIAKFIIDDVEIVNYKPRDRNLPSPNGGFKYYHYHCTLININLIP